MTRLLLGILSKLFLISLCLAGVASGQTPWIKSVRHQQTAYFLFDGKIERYDIQNNSWLSGVALPATGAKSIVVSDRGVYVAIGSDIHRFDLNLGNRSILTTTALPLAELLMDGDMLMAVQTGSGITVNFRPLGGGSPIQSNLESTTWNLPAGSSVATVANKIFGRSTRGPADIIQVTYKTAGGLLTVLDSPYAGGALPSASKTYVMPGETLVVDNAGIVYAASDLSYAGSFGGGFTDIAFQEDSRLPVVLRGNRLGLFDSSNRETTSAILSAEAASVHLTPDAAIAFIPENTARGVRAERVAFSDFQPPASAAASNPAGLTYTADQILMDRDGIVLVYSAANRTVFRWSPDEGRYLDGIGLSDTPSTIAYSAEEHSLYLGYSTGAITRIAAAPGSVAQPFANLPTAVRGLVATDRHLLAVHYMSSERFHRVFNRAGSQLDAKARSTVSSVYEYSPGSRKVFWFHDSTTGGILHSSVITESGVLGPDVETPYLKPNISDTPPIRPNAVGTRVAIARGIIFGGNPLDVAYEMERTSTDLGWVGETLYGIEPHGTGNTSFHRWTADWNVERSRVFSGTPLRVLPGEDRSVVITQHEGKPRFYTVSPDFAVLSDSLGGRMPLIAAQPESTRAHYGDPVMLSVQPVGSGPFTYRWTKDDVEVPGATAADLFVENCGSADAGIYQVRVSNEVGSVISATARLAVGPIRNSPFTAGNLLVSSRDRLYEARTSGQVVRSIQVPNPFARDFAHRVEDAVVDQLGRVHVMFKAFSGGSEPTMIGTYDPEFEFWNYTRLWESFAPNANETDLSLAGDTLITNRMVTVNTRNRHVRRLPPIYNSFSRPNLNGGLDGYVYGVELGRVIVRYHPETWARLQTTTGAQGSFLTGATAAADGMVYGVTTNRRIGIFPPGSSDSGTYMSLTPLQDYTYFDFNLSTSGLIAMGTGNPGLVVLANPSLRTASTVTVAGVTGGVYAGWVEAPVIPAPAFAGTPPATTLEDALFVFDPMVIHPDPDANLTLSLEAAPPWLRLDETGKLTGTPLVDHIGTSAVRLTATDSFGISTTISFDLEVLEVNDQPLAIDHETTEEEDAPPFDIPLGPLFSDEETPDERLVFQIVSNSNPALVTPTLGTGSIRITPVKDAYGSTTVLVRATDEGGLTVESEIHITLTAVNDPPVFTSAVPDLIAEPAGTPQQLALAPFVFDADPEDSLVWSLGEVTRSDLFSSLAIDPTTGVLDIAYAPYVSGHSDVTVIATDGSDTSASFTFRITLPDLPLPGLSVATTIAVNRQTGLLEQQVTVTSNAARDIAGFDLSITGLPAGVTVQNATNAVAGAWVLRHRTVMAPGASVTFTIEYKVPTRGTAISPQISVTLVTAPQPPTIAAQPGLAVSRCEFLADGGMLIEFHSVPGQSYEVQYTNDGQTWLTSPVAIEATSNRVQWIDRGPPRTASPPKTQSMRLYRVRTVDPEP
ncbi:putative Ig domain-containing protein [Luteolibacter flavescens]|uniref:Ig domain-containing protein n=1 Tax=Luteolibacter flavescens TaxID=1859460 RepID=A0ABT3FVA0_9BACT|nr:putative Ig domain-containing protein [Luteolibacter flavescens]MCW1886900.1 putative Ig domain-containing protein [Luteolibacter flavescens]